MRSSWRQVTELSQLAEYRRYVQKTPVGEESMLLNKESLSIAPKPSNGSLVSIWILASFLPLVQFCQFQNGASVSTGKGEGRGKEEAWDTQEAREPAYRQAAKKTRERTRQASERDAKREHAHMRADTQAGIRPTSDHILMMKTRFSVNTGDLVSTLSSKKGHQDGPFFSLTHSSTSPVCQISSHEEDEATL